MAPRRPRRSSRRVAAAALALASLGIAGWLVVLPIVLRPRVEALLTASLGAPAVVGSLSVGPRADLFLRAVRIGNPASGPTLEELDVDPDARRVLRGDLVLNRVAARGLRVGLGVGAYGGVGIRGLEPASDEPRPQGFDIREAVIREARAEIPTSRDSLRIDVDRLVMRQVPDSVPGGMVATGFLEGRLDGFPIRCEGLVEAAGEGRRLRFSLVPEAVRFPGEATGLPDLEAERIGRIADLLGVWPEAEIVLRHGCPPRPNRPGAPGTSPGVERRRMDSVRSAILARGVEAGAVVEASSGETAVDGPTDTARGEHGPGGGCVQVEVRMDRSSLADPAAS